MPSAEWRRWQVGNTPMYSNMAVENSTRVFHRFRSSISTCMRLQNDSVNTPAESFNGLYKTELIYRRGPWKNDDDVEWTALIYIN